MLISLDRMKILITLSKGNCTKQKLMTNERPIYFNALMESMIYQKLINEDNGIYLLTDQGRKQLEETIKNFEQLITDYKATKVE